MSLLSDLLFAETTELSESELNRRVRVLVDAIEGLRAFAPDWEEQVNLLRQVGLNRINEALLPAYDAILGLAQLGALFSAQSSSEVTVGTGERVFAIAEDKRIVFAPAANLAITLDGDPAVAMYGRLTSYDRESGVLVVEVSDAAGAGAHAGWTISASPPRSFLHDLRTDNPHGVTAAQVGTITAAEIDADLDMLLAEILGTATPAMDTLGKLEVGLGKRVRVDAGQALSPAEAGQARANIGLDRLAGTRNYLINGDFAINQRGTSTMGATSANRYGPDRWGIDGWGTTTMDYTLNAFAPGQTDVPGNPRNYLTMNIANFGGMGVDAGGNLFQRIEGVQTLAGKEVTLTFYARSTVPGRFGVSVSQRFGTGGDPSVIVLEPVGTVPVGNSWTKCALKFVIPSVAGKTIGANGDDSLVIAIGLSASTQRQIYGQTIISGNSTVDIARVSLVEGDATLEADPFPFRPMQQELGLCERYYERITDPLLPGMIDTATLARAVWNFRTRKRTTGTLSFSSQVNGKMLVPGADPTSTALAAGRAGVDFASVNFTSTDMTPGYGGLFYMINSTDYIEIDAEL